MIIRLIIYAIIIFIIIKILRSFFPSSPDRRSRFASGNQKMVVDEMVRDPHCGIYIAKKEAFSRRVKNEVLYFCSEECCNKYLRKIGTHSEK